MTGESMKRGTMIVLGLGMLTTAGLTGIWIPQARIAAENRTELMQPTAVVQAADNTQSSTTIQTEPAVSYEPTTAIVITTEDSYSSSESDDIFIFYDEREGEMPMVYDEWTQSGDPI